MGNVVVDVQVKAVHGAVFGKWFDAWFASAYVKMIAMNPTNTWTQPQNQ
jgi:hypothetical protein